MIYDREKVQDTLSKSWSKESAKQWTPANPAAGQCNVTAAVIYSLFGGEILSTPIPTGRHFYNRISGEVVDFTALQFDDPISYENQLATLDEALANIPDREYEALLYAFSSSYPDGNALSV